MNNIAIFLLSAATFALVFTMCDQSTLEIVALPTLLICTPAMIVSMCGMVGGWDIFEM